jgi:hypothetical protein
MLLAILLISLSGISSTQAQLRLATYNYMADVGTDFHTFEKTDYTYGLGMTNTYYTNVTTGWIIAPGIIASYCTNGAGWDTNTGGLFTTRSRDSAEQVEGGAYTNQVSTNETWSGEGPTFPDGNYPAVNLGYLTKTVTFDYLTGGDPSNCLTRVYEITVFDAKENGTIALDPTDAMVNGTNCDGEGRVYVTWTDCTTNTISVTFPTDCTNVYYKVSVGMVRPQIFLVRASYGVDTNGNVDTNIVLHTTNVVTDATNTVTVGEKITLICKMATDSGVVVTNPVITAWSWSIGGLTISNYVADNSSGTVYEPYDKDKQTCVFYWKDGTNAAIVICNATVNGAVVPTIAYFNVTKPNPSFSVVLDQFAIAVDGAHASSEVGDVSLHWGTGFVGESAGITYNYTPVTNQWSICQLVTSTTRKNFHGAVIDVESGAGLDTAFPFYTESDSPANGIGINDDEVWADDEFRVWLMHKPPTPGAIWVPIRKITEKFGWDAKAVKAANGQWNLTLAKTLPEGTTLLESEETDSYPTWNKNVPSDNVSVTVPR